MGEYVKFKNFERKIKSSFMTYADYKSILVPEDNEMQHLNESYTNKYQKHVAFSYDYKLECVDDRLVFADFISSMIEESKYCSNMMKKLFNKELVMTKEDNEDFDSSTKCWICDSDYIDDDDDVKVRRDHCQDHCQNAEDQHSEIVISMLS